MVKLLNPPTPRTPPQSHSAVLVNDVEKRVDREIKQLVQDIHRIGPTYPPGTPQVLFGELFDDDEVQQYYEALVGTLKCAKKRGVVDFKGQMLLKGMHDKVVISVAIQEEQRSSAEDGAAPAATLSVARSSLPAAKRAPPRGKVQAFTFSPPLSIRTNPAPSPLKSSYTVASERKHDYASDSEAEMTGHRFPGSGTSVGASSDSEMEVSPRSRSKRTGGSLPSWFRVISPGGTLNGRKEGAQPSLLAPKRAPRGKPPKVHSSKRSPLTIRTKAIPSPLQPSRTLASGRKYDYASDSEAEISGRRTPGSGASVGASSDSEMEVSPRTRSKRTGKSLPSWFSVVSSGGSLDERKEAFRRKASSSASVGHRWSGRPSVSSTNGHWNSAASSAAFERPTTVSKSCKNHSLETVMVSDKTHTSKEGRAPSSTSLSSETASPVVNKENQTDNATASGKPKRPWAKKRNTLTRRGSNVTPTGHTVGNRPGSARNATGPPPLVKTKSQIILRPSVSDRDEEVEQLLEDIRRVGTNPGEPNVTFGELFDDDGVQNTYEALVGTLRSAKRQGLIQFDGQVLFKGMHDHVTIQIVAK